MRIRTMLTSKVVTFAAGGAVVAVVAELTVTNRIS